MKGLFCEKLKEKTRLDWDGRNGELASWKYVFVCLCDKALKGKRLAQLIRL